MKKTKKQKTMQPCDFYKNKNLKNTHIKVVGWKRSCAAHREIGKEFSFTSIAPKNFCIFAYHNAYQYALSILYAGKKHRKVEVCCPATSSYIIMKIYTKAKKFKSLYVLAEKLFRFINFPMDIIEKSVKIKVIDVKGKCPIGIRKGQQFKFNINNKNELCPAGSNLLLPFIMSKLADPKQDILLQCPADACRIKYKINIGD